MGASPKFVGFHAALLDARAIPAVLPVQLALGLRSLGLVDTDAEMQRRLAYAIRAAMAEKSWKPPDLARALKRDPSTVNRWVNGESVPNMLMTKALAEALGVRPELLFDPPPVPDYPLTEYLVRREGVAGVEQGIERSRRRRRAVGDA